MSPHVQDHRQPSTLPAAWLPRLIALLALVLATAVPASPPEALREAAAGGDADAQARLGERLYRGDGVARDPAAAFTWLRRAAEQGSLTAQRGLVVLYYNGEGTSQNLVEALKWALTAAGQDDPEATSHRDYLRARLAPFQVREAEQLAAAWRPHSEAGATR